MNQEPTELAPSETVTGSIYAWALDHDDEDEFPTQPTRLTPRRITALSVAASLILIAVAGAVALAVMRQPEAQTVQAVAPAPPATTMIAAPPPVTVTMLPPPPPVTVTAAAPTSTVQARSGPTIGDECHDRMKFSTDPVSGQVMLCDGYSENLSRGEPMKWYSAEEGAVGPSKGWANAPRVGRVGSSCDGEVPFTMGRSSDGYAVACEGGPGSYMPGTTPTWTVFHP